MTAARPPALAGDPALIRTVELKLREYHEHLLRVVEGFDSADGRIAACRRRFKNLPERHFRSLESLVRQHFKQFPSASPCGEPACGDAEASPQPRSVARKSDLKMTESRSMASALLCPAALQEERDMANEPSVAENTDEWQQEIGDARRESS